MLDNNNYFIKFSMNKKTHINNEQQLQPLSSCNNQYYEVKGEGVLILHKLYLQMAQGITNSVINADANNIILFLSQLKNKLAKKRDNYPISSDCWKALNILCIFLETLTNETEQDKNNLLSYFQEKNKYIQQAFQYIMGVNIYQTYIQWYHTKHTGSIKLSTYYKRRHKKVTIEPIIQVFPP